MLVSLSPLCILLPIRRGHRLNNTNNDNNNNNNNNNNSIIKSMGERH